MQLRKLISIISIPIILLLFHNRVANWHLHMLYNGIVVEHAHPFSSNKTSDYPYQSHSHNNWELFLYETLTTATTLVILAFLFLAKLDFGITQKSSLVSRGYIPITPLPSNTYRGPPMY